MKSNFANQCLKFTALAIGLGIIIQGNAVASEQNKFKILSPSVYEKILNEAKKPGIKNFDQAVANVLATKRMDINSSEVTRENVSVLQKLRTLQIDIDKSDVETLKLIGQLTNLKILDFKEAQIKNNDLQYLSSLKNLEDLDLENTGITDAGLVYLRALKQLYVLSLAKTKITDAGLSNLSELQYLLGLNLDDTKITDAGLEHLYKLKSLVRINLKNTGITDAGIADLKRQFPNISIVR